MMNYIDEYGRIHDRPVTAEDPIPSNNGWIYSAYADLAGIELDKKKMHSCFLLCRRSTGPDPLKIDRSPGKVFPPISRDEILGLFHFGYINVSELERSYWQFCNFDEFVPIKFSRISFFL